MSGFGARMQRGKAGRKQREREGESKHALVKGCATSRRKRQARKGVPHHYHPAVKLGAAASSQL